ncbi:MAG TPA: sulfatase-like hydrolase/transferase, partial [Pirellulales bacterium]|nr:sulfatase-like hydrolase/transferase [Pirellulales bacterium]
MSLASSRSALGASPAPDVLFIFCDQWSVRYTSWDNPQVRTPNLDRIARDGMIFDAAYSNSPVCMPARVSLVTGLYPHNQGHSLWGNANKYHLSPASAPMFRDIQSAGYTTAQIGKLHWFTGSDWRSEFASLDDYHRAMGLDIVTAVNGPPDSSDSHDPYCNYLRGKGLLDSVAKDIHDRYLNDQYEPRASVAGPEDYHDTFVTNEAIEVIRRQPRDKPLCLVLSLHAPHPPLDAPGEFATMFDPKTIDLPKNVPEQYSYGGQSIDRADVQRMVANYLGKMALVDANIGRMIEAMRARGTWDDAFVAFSADHGEMMGAHGHMSKGQMYEESVRVPLVIRWPGHVQPGRTDALAMMFDLYPTIVEAIDGKVSPGRFARSLLPACETGAATVHPLVV